MFSSQMMPAPTAKWKDLSIKSIPNLPQLDNMKTQLDLVLIALESLGKISSEAMAQAARDLNLDSIVADGRKKLDLEKVRALVLIASHLADRQQDLIRQAVACWEQSLQQHQSPHQDPVLADYIDSFITIYQERMQTDPPISSEVLMQAALKLLIELLFYSSPNGHQRLWAALWQRSH